jgi:uncharacterized protein YkwD
MVDERGHANEGENALSTRSIVGASRGRSRRRQLLVKLGVGAIVVGALVTSIASLALATTPSFPDVPASHQYYAAITDLASRSIIGGFANGNFGPSDPVTRQQFAKMIVLTGGYAVSESDVCPFADVPIGDATTFYPDNYVAVCAAKGISTGKTPTTFDPTGTITRYQVVSMVVRMADNLQPGVLAAPPVAWSGNVNWAADSIHGSNAARAEYNGLLTGLDLAALDPAGNMTRGEVAQVLHNLLGKVPTTTSSSGTNTTVALTSTTTTAPPTTTTTLGPHSAEEVAMVQLVNEFRVSNGAEPLLVSEILSECAARHSHDMAKYGFFSQVTTQSDWFAAGASPSARAVVCGYPSDAQSDEIIAAGFGNAADAFEAMSHMRASASTMRGTSWKVIGVGLVRDSEAAFKTYWTVVFGSYVDGTAH